jgi:adenylylsulfate kinase
MAGDRPLSELSEQIRQGFMVWFTGLPAAGKTTLARAVRKLLAEKGIAAIVLDSDELRRILTPNPTYSEEERDWFYAVVADLAAWLVGSGVHVLVAATAHRRSYRARARAQVANFAEVYVRCSPAACRARDPKGLYVRAAAGTVHGLPGVDVEFEPPGVEAIVVDTETVSPEEGALRVVTQLASWLVA